MRAARALSCAVALSTALGLSACGNDDPDNPSLLAGQWILEAGTSCGLFLEFDKRDRSFILQDLCVWSGPRAEIEARAGTYSATDTTITMNLTHSSCPGETRSTASFDYRVTRSALTLHHPTGATVLERAPAGDGSFSGVIHFGCWNDDDTFTRAPFVELPAP